MKYVIGQLSACLSFIAPLKILKTYLHFYLKVSIVLVWDTANLMDLGQYGRKHLLCQSLQNQRVA